MLILFYDMLDTEEQEQLFEEIYNSYHKLMFYIARSYMEIEQDVEDAVWIAFYRIAKNIQIFEKNISPKCPQNEKLIVIIMKCVCIDMLRKQKRSVKTVSFSEGNRTNGQGNTVEAQIMKSVKDQDLNQLLSVLTEAERTAIILHYIHGYKMREIAALLDTDIEVIKKRVNRGIKKCREVSRHERKGSKQEDCEQQDKNGAGSI